MNFGPIADANAGADIGERPDRHAGAERCRRIDERGGRDALERGPDGEEPIDNARHRLHRIGYANRRHASRQRETGRHQRRGGRRGASEMFRRDDEDQVVGARLFGRAHPCNDSCAVADQLAVDVGCDFAERACHARSSATAARADARCRRHSAATVTSAQGTATARARMTTASAFEPVDAMRDHAATAIWMEAATGVNTSAMRQPPAAKPCDRQTPQKRELIGRHDRNGSLRVVHAGCRRRVGDDAVQHATDRVDRGGVGRADRHRHCARERGNRHAARRHLACRNSASVSGGADQQHSQEQLIEAVGQEHRRPE